MPLGEKWKIDEVKKIAVFGFMEEFNDRCKKVEVVGDATDAKYKFTMKVTKMDQYFKVMGFVPGNATKVWGEFTITDIATGEVLVKAKIDEVNGGANPSPDGSISDCFEELGKEVSRIK